MVFTALLALGAFSLIHSFTQFDYNSPYLGWFINLLIVSIAGVAASPTAAIINGVPLVLPWNTVAFVQLIAWALYIPFVAYTSIALFLKILLGIVTVGISTGVGLLILPISFALAGVVSMLLISIGVAPASQTSSSSGSDSSTPGSGS
jgi:hypothetical protein